jgi:hypothetical protein
MTFKHDHLWKKERIPCFFVFRSISMKGKKMSAMP